MNADKFSYLVKQSLIFWLALVTFVISKPVISADLPISQAPLAVSSTAAPRVMLAMSRDHQLFIKAYTDYSDLNKDGILDTTYNNSVDYYGYFDSNKCYTYSGGLFVPSGPAGGHKCSSEWSGNFLNWATMTRMDIIRKVLYGGYRSTDGGYGGNTILERTLIPYDAHAFVKVFSSSEMQNYTPYTNDVISICNLTQGTGISKDLVVTDTAYPPLMRVASGSVNGGTGWPGWASSASYQCQWGNGAQPGITNMLAELNVRVQVCVSGREETNCKNYTDPVTLNITKKPTGLLQKYWDSEKPISFGLMTGSWGNNKSGGVLRKALPTDAFNLGEVVPEDGTFNLGNDAIGGIIATLDHFRISYYDFDRKEYKNCSTGKLSFNNGECVDWGNPLSEIYLETLRYLVGKGSPTSAFDTDDSGYFSLFSSPSNMSHSLDKKVWDDPILEFNWCARCSIVVISTGLNSYDADELGNNLEAVDGTKADTVTQTDLVGNLESMQVNGNYQNNEKYLIGDIFSSMIDSDHNKQCTEKTLSKLSDARGICPEVPSQVGGYDIAGLAYYARTHDFREEYTRGGVVFFPGVQSINTYSVALAESLPRFEIPVGSGTIAILPACEANANPNASTDWRPCSMTDLIVEKEKLKYDGTNLVSGSFLVNWEDSTWGSNYDMDGIERVEFCVGPTACHDSTVSAGKIKITVSLIQVESDQAMRFGYTISGSSNSDDGIHFPVLCSGNSNCSVVAPNVVVNPLPIDYVVATANEYSKGDASAKLLENPLWYAAKYGGFDTIDSDITVGQQTPQNQSWDEDINEIPDAFFKANNPTLLESSLDEILSNVASKSASSASAAANSTRLDTTAALYQAKYNPSRWNGQLLAYKINSQDGSIPTVPSWDAGEILTAQGTARPIFSFNDSTKTGVDFVYSNLSTSQQQLLTEDELNYIKGDQSREKPKGTLRTRTGPNRLMGDIVNSDPEFINSISQGYDCLPGSEGSDYLKYITSPAYIGRAPMLAVGANDGMLHVFNASLGDTDSGKEIVAYVPTTIISKLKDLTLPTYIVQGNHQYFVDGSPNAGDAYFDADGKNGKEWRSALVGTTAAGGKGIFALDLTLLNPVDHDYKTKEAFSANRVLWEINDTAAPNNADLDCELTKSNCYGFKKHLGLTIGQASIVRMADGNFAAVFGNGYNSVNQTAVLYIVDIKTGYLIRSITTEAGPSVSAPNNINGLATPLTVDGNGDLIVDAIYAGDYLGNMWKFDVSDNNHDNWKVAFTISSKPAPLFTAKSSHYDTPDYQLNGDKAQPITAKPEFGKHPNGGIMLYFGTGKYFLNSDNTVSIYGEVESFYGIWDKCVKYAGGTESCNNSPISNKTQLVQQTIDYEADNAGSNVRVTSGNPVDYLDKKGWYMDLYNGSGNVTGEKVISQAILRNRRIIFPTIIPARGACSFGGSSWLMLVDALTGKNLDTTAFDLTGNGTFTDGQITYINKLGVKTTSSVSGIQSKVGMIDTPAIVKTDSAKDNFVAIGSSSEQWEVGVSGLPGGRQSWMQIR